MVRGGRRRRAGRVGRDEGSADGDLGSGSGHLVGLTQEGALRQAVCAAVKHNQRRAPVCKSCSCLSIQIPQNCRLASSADRKRTLKEPVGLEWRAQIMPPQINSLRLSMATVKSWKLLLIYKEKLCTYYPCIDE